MRGLVFTTAILLSTSAFADEGEITVGLAGGAAFTDQLEPFGQGITAGPFFGYGLYHGVRVEADFRYGMGQTRSQPLPDETIRYSHLSPRINFYGDAMADEVISPYVVVGPGVALKAVDEQYVEVLPTGVTASDLDFVFNMGAGLVYDMTDDIEVRLENRLLMNFGSERYANHGDTFMNWETTLGLAFTFGGKDTDQDGITDGSDACADEAEDLDGYEDEDGCPDLDNDLDGVLDADEECDNEPEDADGFEDEDGCPDPDNDGDGFMDADDSCPVDAGVESAGGCPDADGDGIQDLADACPTEPGPDATKGCPDTDGDTVIDSDDECPEEAGSVEAFGCVDTDGDTVGDYRDECPEEADPEDAVSRYSSGCPARVYATETEFFLVEGVAFLRNSETIAKDSKPDLDALADLLVKHEDLVVKIKVHANKGRNETTVENLTKLRAASIKQHLLDKGVEARRIGAKGFGSSEAKEPAEGEEPINNERIVFDLFVLAPEEPEEAEGAEGAEGEEAPTDEETPEQEQAPSDEAE